MAVSTLTPEPSLIWKEVGRAEAFMARMKEQNESKSDPVIIQMNKHARVCAVVLEYEHWM